MAAKRKIKSDALQFAYNRYIGNNPERVTSFEEELANAELARKICDLRTKAGLTHGQLAKLVGTTAAVIRQLEEADYAGHMMAMLNRIAAALNQRVEIRCVAAKGKRQAA
jgi:DNA-binding XRE family transcriptional regulator